MGIGSNMKVFILCGGKGERMTPFSTHWNKSCLPIGNISVIELLVKRLLAIRNFEIIILYDYLGSQVKQTLQNYKEIQYIQCRNDQLFSTLYEQSKTSDNILVCYGDVFLSQNDLTSIINCCEAKQNAMLLDTNVEHFRSQDYICAMYEQDKVLQIYGHPRPHYVNSRSCGIFALNRIALDYLPYTSSGFDSVPCGGMPNHEYYLEQLMHRMLKNGEYIHACFIKDYFVDINFPWDIMQANQIYSETYFKALQTTNRYALDMDKSAIVDDSVIFEGNCKIGKHAIIRRGAIIGANCIIGDYTIIENYAKIAANTVIGNNNKIGFTAEVAGVTFDGVAAIHNCEVYGVIGKSVDIAAGVQMGIMKFDDLPVSMNVLGKHYVYPYTNAIYIGDYVRTGITNIIYPGIRIGSNSCLGPGLIVDKDIEANQLVLVEQTKIYKNWGSNRYGW